MSSQTDIASSNTKNSSSTALAVAVGASAGAAVVSLLGLFFFCRRRKRNMARVKPFPLSPTPFNPDQSSNRLSTDPPTSEFFPMNVDSYYSSVGGTHRGPIQPSSSKETFHPATPLPEATTISSPLSILPRREDGPASHNFPLQLMRHSEAARQLQEHMGTRENHRPQMSIASQRTHVQRQTQALSVRETEDPPPEYAS
jgi:hypothetical protein